MLEQIAHFNNLSPELASRLEKQIDAFGETARFRFDISSNNPDPEKYNGNVIWPSIYSLKPITWKITDKEEKREKVSKTKTIGLIKHTNDKGIPDEFDRIKITEGKRGLLEIKLDTDENRAKVAYLLLHPKMREGAFAEPGGHWVVETVDRVREAQESKAIRDTKFEAMKIAKEMTDAQIREFASAMSWNDGDNIDILRAQVEDQAEYAPDLFTNLVGSDKLEYQANAKKAIGKGIISSNPVDGTFGWSSNQQTVVVLGASTDGRNDVERFAEWLMTGGNKADEVYKKIKSLLK